MTASLATHGLAQDTWTRVVHTAKLPVNSIGPMVYDSHRKVVVLFDSRLRETWEWDGVGWKKRTHATTPPSLGSPAIAYDQNRKVTVMFGDSRNRDTWEWNGTDWRLAGMASQGRRDTAMAYDGVKKVIVRFGGNDGSPVNDTWSWDGTTWKLVALAGPPPRVRHRMVWDSVNRRVVMFGGMVKGTSNPRTWEWDGSLWHERRTQVHPSNAWMAFAFHPGIAKTMMAGGGFKSGQLFGYDGRQWLRHQPIGSISAAQPGYMVYDAARAEILMIGRPFNTGNINAAVFAYRASPKTLGKSREYGTSCGGSQPPRLRFREPPYIGYTTELELAPLPSSGFAIPFLFLGDSDRSWGGVPLPLDLTGMGGPGCHLYANPVLLIIMQRIGNAATAPAKIPLRADLVGLGAFVQGFVLDSTANAMGAAVSNGVQGTIGRRW